MHPRPSDGTRLLRSSAAVLLASLLAVALPPHVARASSLARAAAPSSAPPSSPLRVTVDPTIADAALWPQWLAERNPALAEALALPGHEQWIELRIDGATYDYRVSIIAMRDGTPLEPGTTPLACECNAESLLSLLDDEIANTVELLRTTAAAPSPAPTPPKPDPGPTRPPSSSPSPAPTRTDALPRRWQVSPLGVGGAATGAFGLLVLGGGVSLVVAEDREIPGRSKLYRELDPLGYATIAAGTTAVAVGIVLLAIDVARSNRAADRAPRRARTQRTRSPHVPPRSALFSLSSPHRFRP